MGVLNHSAAVPGLEATQLANDQGSASQAWQAPGTSGEASVTMPGDGPVGVGSLHRTNLTAAATVRWRVLNKAGALVHDTGVRSARVAAGYGQSVTVFPPGVVGCLVLFTISDLANPDGFLNIPQAFAGPAWQPERNIGYASSRLRDDGTTVTTTRSGAEIVRNDWQRRGWSLSFGAIRPIEVLTVEQLDAQARLGGNILFVPNPDSAFINQEAVFGRLKPAAAGIGYANNSAQTRTWQATINERL